MTRKQTIGETVSGKPSQVIFDTLRKAGYNLESESEIRLGVLAYQSALLLSEKQPAKSIEDADRRHARPGRNAPCPCGSGRKFKKCCMGKQKAAGHDSGTKPGLSTPDPALIPNILDEEPMLHDLAVLEDLFRADEGLNKVRYPRKTAAEFLEKNFEAHPDPFEDEFAFEEWLDPIAARYDREIDGGSLMGSVTDELIDAASRAKTTGDTRSLALGLFLAMLYEVDKDDPNPLVCLIFRLSASGHLRLASFLESGIERLGGKQALKKRLLEDDPDLQKELDNLSAGMDQDVIEAMKEEFNRDFDEIVKVIEKGEFPVPLPYVTVLPFVVKLMRLAEDGETDAEKTAKMLLEYLKGLSTEDFRLYRKHLKSWLESNEKKEPELAAHVAFVHNLTKLDRLDPLDGYLLFSGLKLKASVLLEGESEILPCEGEAPDSPEFLERYGNFFEELGYPALAERTRNLAER